MNRIEELKKHWAGSVAAREVIRNSDTSTPAAVNAAHRQLERAEDAAMDALPHLIAVAEAAEKSREQLAYIVQWCENRGNDPRDYPNLSAECATRVEEIDTALANLKGAEA